MVKKETDRLLFLQGQKSVQGKTSLFKPDIPSLNYYTKTKQLKSGGSIADKFQYSFDSQVVPNVLPGLVTTQDYVEPPQFIASELDIPITSEGSENLITE